MRDSHLPLPVQPMLPLGSLTPVVQPLPTLNDIVENDTLRDRLRKFIGHEKLSIQEQQDQNSESLVLIDTMSLL